VRDGDMRGIKAKTIYPPCPSTWNDKETWMPDQVFAQIQAGLLNAKSIGFLPTKAHFADAKETVKNHWPDGTLVIEEWLLIEYAVGIIPVNPETVVEVVSKSLAADCSPLVQFTAMVEIEKAIQQCIESIDLRQLTQETLDRMRGKIA
jgi:hypothetical protein